MIDDRPTPEMARQPHNGRVSEPAHSLVPVRPPIAADSSTSLTIAVDACIGAVASGLGLAATVTSGAWSIAGPAVQSATRVVLRPPLVPERLAPATLLAALTRRGTHVRRDVADALAVSVRADAPRAAASVGELVGVEAVVDALLSQVDLTALVLRNVDITALVTEALDALDVAALIEAHVDIAAVAQAALAQLDLTGIAREHLDLAGLADEVIDEVDLPEIIRDSTTGVATGVVHEARIRAITGDALITRWVDRALLRRARDTDTDGEAT